MPGSPLSLCDCFQAGVDARARGVRLVDNPFAPGCPHHEEWRAGWVATLDLDEDDDPCSTRSAETPQTDRPGWSRLSGRFAS